MTDNLIDSKMLKTLLLKAFRLGEIYSDQGNSDSYRENRKATDTYTKFTKLIEDAIGLLGGQND